MKQFNRYAMHRKRLRIPLLFALCLLLSSCVGMAVGAAVVTTIEIAKVPFKVAGAVVGLAVPDNDDE